MNDTATTLGLFASLAVTLCAIIARFWPRPKTNGAWLQLYLLVNAVAQNGGHATNAADVAARKS
ncbi:hypothetical protein K2X14_10285 [Acetobacter sp. TBRC 12305]|uniref:Uncharacterized protein n=1 Tax=Acetobacter garciniae TaxID=2817435 RepID=A0A939KNT4_9PROT|nr:hypothetical protein [Acetobacter garciniae]MBO1326035.1 hypothetical protein [Acetobacter garciniae]MBX0345221.1 hypothetical protein [Acetobacter garciniae]